MKRKLRGLLDDPMGTIALGSQRMSEDVQQMGLLADEAGYMPGTNSVLLTPEQKARARKQLADKGAEMAMAAATVWHGSPHKFKKFEVSDKTLGTGDGSQMQGVGAYVGQERKVGERYAGPKGNLYKVDLQDDAIGKMFDLDAPVKSQMHLGQQLNAIHEADPSIRDLMFSAVRENETGQNLFDSILEKHAKELLANGVSREKVFDAANRLASKRFQDAGIPGIRYLDRGSRGAGAGTSNYVVFPGNEGLLKILERNGQAVNP